MRFDYLNLLAFGHFTNYELSFDPEKNFHLIYGANEAGKSTTLRSIYYFLFGFPQITKDAFLHEMSKLRIQGQIRNANGDALQFIRRKGRKNTVLDVNGKPFPEKEVEKFISGISETHFLNTFALNHERLRKGGESLLESGGDVGESLFAAASGMTLLRETFREFDQKSLDLYNKRGKTQKLNKLLKEEKDLQKNLAEYQLKVKEWKELERTFKERLAEIEELNKKMEGLQSRHELLKRVKYILPKMAARKDLIGKIQSMGDIPDLPDDIKDERINVINRLANAKKDKENAEKEISLIDEKIREIHIPEKLLEQGPIIEELYKGLHSYQNHLNKVPELEGKLSHLEREIIRLMKEIDPSSGTIENVDSYRISAEKKETIRVLAGEKPLIDERLEHLGKRMEELKQDRNRKKELLNSIQIPENVGQLESIVDKIKRGERQLDEADLLKNKTEELEEEMDREMAKLPLWKGSLQELASLAVPVLKETINQFEKERNDLIHQLEKMNDQLKEYNHAIEENEKQIRILDSKEEIPSIEKLLSARELRDKGWNIIRQKLETDIWDENLDQYTNGRPITSVYEEKVKDADQISDIMRLHGEKVGEKNKLQSDINALKLKIEHLQEQEKILEKQCLAWDERWRKLWEGIIVDPLSPAEMKEWIERHERIKALYNEYEKTTLELEKLRKTEEEYKKELIAALREHDTVSDSLSVKNLLSILDEKVKQFREKENERKHIENSLESTIEELEKTAMELASKERELEDWKDKWKSALLDTGISSDIPVNAAANMLSLYDSCTRQYDEMEKQKEELNGVKRQIHSFEQKVKDVLEAVQMDDNGQNAAVSVNQLYSALRNGEKEQTNLKNLLTERENWEERLKRAFEELEQANMALSLLLDMARVKTIEELEEAERKYFQKKKLEEELEFIEKEMLEHGSGKTVDELIEEAKQFDYDRIDGDLERIQIELARLKSDWKEKERSFGVIEKEYKEKIEGNNAAAIDTQQKILSVHANIASVTENYIQLKLASVLLRKGIEFYRNQNQNPIITRASEIFARLTLNSFIRLTVDFDEKDQPVLVGIRNNGEKVFLEGMSDGTIDQLYLALRIASIEKYVKENEPVPFILDDILVNFDDKRSMETFQVLLELSEWTQIIFFTHHRHLKRLLDEAGKGYGYQFIEIAQKEILPQA